MKIGRKIRLAILGVALAGCGAAGQATTLEKMSVARMSQAAPAVVRARCVSNATAWDRGEIWTFTTFEVSERWKQAPGAPIPAQITVRLLGGTMGALTSHVSGVPRFAPGEEVVLFLERTARGDFSVVSWAQGTFRIRRDAGSGREVVTQDTAAFGTFHPHTRRFEAGGIREMRIESLRAKVEAATGSGGAE